MVSKEISKSIRKRIAERKRIYSKKDQRAELLKRNPYFIQELSKIQFDPSDEADFDLQPKIRDYQFFLNMLNPIEEFRRFCCKWGISQQWNKKVEDLQSYTNIGPRIIYDVFRAGELNVDSEISRSEAIKTYQEFKRDRLGVELEQGFATDFIESGLFLYIKLDPWTTLEDVKASWRRVEKLKKAIFGYSGKAKCSFSDALCWYDLNREYKQSLGKIVQLWIQKVAPYIKDKESFRVTVREGIKRIDRYIKMLTPQTSLIKISQ